VILVENQKLMLNINFRADDVRERRKNGKHKARLHNCFTFLHKNRATQVNSPQLAINNVDNINIVACDGFHNTAFGPNAWLFSMAGGIADNESSQP